VRVLFDLGDGLALALPGPGVAGGHPEPYPTSSLQKGLLLLDGGQELGGEGVGFGVPVLKRGARAVFPGSAEVTERRGSSPTVTLVYVLDRVERLGGRRRSIVFLRPLDWAREAFALLYRRVPPLRRALLAASNGVRWLLRVHTRFEPIEPVARVAVTYSLPRTGELLVRADLAELPRSVTEVVFMNELDAGAFDRWIGDDGRTAVGAGIGAWNEAGEGWSRFLDAERRVSFACDGRPDENVPRVRLFRGREQARGRLAWAGFGYTLPPGPDGFSYAVRFAREADGA